jgi:hypothetical protein
MTHVGSRTPIQGRTTRSAAASFTLRTGGGIDIGGYASRDRAMSAARWVARRSGERVDVTCTRTGQVWDAQPPDA